jgi:hypothetical protein
MSSGKVKFAVPGTLGTTISVQSSSTYSDGNWHLAVGTASGAIVTTVSLYVDGSSTSFAGASLLSSSGGYWHLGWSSAGGYFNGTLSDAFVIDGSAAADASTLHNTASQSAWTTAMSNDHASQTWDLAESGTNTYTGSLPLSTGSDACSYVGVAIGSGSYCIYPSAGSPCATPTVSTTNTLRGWVGSNTLTFAATAVGSPALETTKLIAITGYDTTFMSGLRLYVPVTVTESLTSTSPWSTTLTWNSTSQQVTG